MAQTASRQVRRAVSRDIPRLLELFALARQTMRADGNLSQWAGTYPDEEAVRRDLSRKVSYVIEEEGRVIGTFAFIPGAEPTYRRIWRGRWLDRETPYATIHRIAGDPAYKRIFDTCLDWCWERMPNIRIDTHRDNHIMQSLLLKSGFSCCGIIYLSDGAERLAFQRIADVERLRKDAKLVLPARCGALAERYGFCFNRVFIKHNRSNWGSCSSKRNINLNLNLVRLPAELRDYVILHELCHLQEMNHGPRFHQMLEALCLDLMGERIPDRPLHGALCRRLRAYGLV
ncbi:MAG: DUF45 domain-containing protein [Bacteroidales bacterium]|nr:DUF45 domain-containing protein [Bacteroidales bacterium]